MQSVPKQAVAHGEPRSSSSERHSTVPFSSVSSWDLVAMDRWLAMQNQNVAKKKQCREMEWQREAETKRDRDKESGHTDGLLRFEAIEQLKIETAEHTLMDRRLSQRGAARRRSYASVPLGYWLISVGPMAAALTAHPGEASIVLGHAQQATAVVPRLRLR